MTELNVPEGLPVLSHGSHQSPVEGACFMEYTALLAGLPFSDSPPCVDGALAISMAHLNDNLTDESRPVLVPFLGRGIGLVAPGRPSIHDYLPVTLCLVCTRDSVCWHHRARFGRPEMAYAEMRVAADACRFSERSGQLQGLVWVRLYRKYEPLMVRAGVFATGTQVSSAVEVIFDALQPKMPPNWSDEEAMQEYYGKLGDVAVRIAEDLHTAYEEAMDVLNWEVKREIACPLPEVIAKVGARD